MEAIAKHQYLRMSPQKVRVVVALIKEMTPSQALITLPHLTQAAAKPLAKVVKSAVANAVQKGAQEVNLRFKEIQVTSGPTLKRGRPVSRGRWHPIRKQTSHLRIVLEAQDSETKGGKK